MTPSEYERYLARIGQAAPDAATAATLAALQEAHLRAIPFEALDPFFGKTPALDLPGLVARLADGDRGGYCFELNLAYGALLAAAGFPARRVLARVRLRNTRGGPRTHLAWLVEAGGIRWLSDVGFGGPAPLRPLRMGAGEQADPAGDFRLVPDPDTGETVLERQEDGIWRPLYSFDQAHVTDGDIAAANHVAATWPHSSFPGNLMLAGFDGPLRIGVFNRAVSETGPTGTTRRILASRAELAALLARLRIVLPNDRITGIWHRLT